MAELTEERSDLPRAGWHSQDSSLREQAIGHLFLGELLAAMWRSNQRDIEVLKAEVDRGGYDLVLEANGFLRHVQLKSSFAGSKVRHVSVGTKLLAKPGGCVIWIEFDGDSLKIERYLWFGGEPGQALPDLGACLDSRCSNLVGSDSTLGDEQVFSALEHRSDAASAAECAGLRAERPCLAVYG
ncbi:hypothetical protein [Bradyrhizobium sp. 2S1]|uniref:hypothetical protein n=1 Tax=Bradyrhizobium sp. 2S1 TaxID=1404429 RepID=UPI00140DE492|nr:hypothetical protein [Bradyrhizobium sp. 2S1]MCK7668282.1 hypothetical protein [Bradyrhizobium sp. 2S1]